MRFIGKRLKGTVGRGLSFFLALMVTSVIRAEDSGVPINWNVAPMTNGAYLEGFETVLPGWAAVGSNLVTNEFPSMAGSSLPTRSNEWFSAHQKVLQLDTGGIVVTNTLVAKGGGVVTFASEPVYIDMKILFRTMSEPPDEALLSSSKLSLFVEPGGKLVAFHYGGATTNDAILDTNKWHQLTIKLLNGKANVLVNDEVLFNQLTINNTGTENVLSSLDFSGTGLVDDLYVSHGDPAYAITGPVGEIPALPANGANIPTAEQQTLINAWLDALPSVTASTTINNLTQDELSLAYLLNALAVTEGVASPPVYTFGISKIDLVSPTSLIVTLALETNGASKSGTINGKIQLQGKANLGDKWTTLSGAISPNYLDFTDGEAAYTFTIPEGGYRFFKPLMVP